MEYHTALQRMASKIMELDWAWISVEELEEKTVLDICSMHKEQRQSFESGLSVTQLPYNAFLIISVSTYCTTSSMIMKTC